MSQRVFQTTEFKILVLLLLLFPIASKGQLKTSHKVIIPIELKISSSYTFSNPNDYYVEAELIEDSSSLGKVYYMYMDASMLAVRYDLEFDLASTPGTTNLILRVNILKKDPSGDQKILEEQKNIDISNLNSNTPLLISPKPAKLLMSGTQNTPTTSPTVPVPTEKTLEFLPKAYNRLCPRHTGQGDCELGGRAEVTLNSNLYIREGDKIFVKIYFHIQEPKADYSEAERTWDFMLWRAPSGTEIVDIDSDVASHCNYLDTDTDLDYPTIKGGDLLSRVVVQGDTGGDDICDCNSGRTYVSLSFNKIKVLTRSK